MPVTAPSSAQGKLFSLTFADDPKMMPCQINLVAVQTSLVQFRCDVRNEVASFAAALSGPFGFMGILIDSQDSFVGKKVELLLRETFLRISKEIMMIHAVSQPNADALNELCRVEIAFILEENDLFGIAKKFLSKKTYEI